MRSVYPSDEELRLLREWPSHDPRGAVLYAQALWDDESGYPVEISGPKSEDLPGCREPRIDVEMRTGGWSGNEEIVCAMQENLLFWHRWWAASERGGYERLEISQAAWDASPTLKAPEGPRREADGVDPVVARYLRAYPERAPWVYEDREGGAYCSIAEYVRGLLGFCGCGDPEAAQALVLRALRALAGEDRYDAIRREIPDVGTRMLILYLFDDKGLTEHGGTVDGCWLVPRGRDILRLLEIAEKEGV